MSATYGLQSGVAFQQVDAAGIGNAQILKEGFIDALDVWGYVDQGVEVCFPGSGTLVFLDASTSPRALSSLDDYSKDDMTCATINSAGTVVLQNSGSAAPTVTAAPASSAASLGYCEVTTTDILNLRASPNGEVIGAVAYKRHPARDRKIEGLVQGQRRRLGRLDQRRLRYSGRRLRLSRLQSLSGRYSSSRKPRVHQRPLDTLYVRPRRARHRCGRIAAAPLPQLDRWRLRLRFWLCSRARQRPSALSRSAKARRPPQPPSGRAIRPAYAVGAGQSPGGRFASIQ